MKTDFSVEYKNWIIALSEDNFNELILNYTKELYKTPSIYISNGPYDGGLDLIITVNEKVIKKSIQITVQKSNLENKLFEDCNKAKVNVDKFNYLNKLDFYTSAAISPLKKNELIIKAFNDYEIDLKIIDANELSGYAESYKSIRDTLLKFQQIAFPKEELDIDKNTKILFDTLSMSKDMTVLKNNFVESIIFNYLYKNPESTVESIYDGLKTVFFDKYNKNFFEKEIGRLKSANKIVSIPESKPKKFSLESNLSDYIEKIDANLNVNEAYLIAEIEGVLSRFNLKDKTKEISKYIIDLYDENYEIDVNEILEGSNDHSKKIQHIFNSLITRLHVKDGLTTEQSNDITRQLLVVCSKNEFLNKTSISKMFTNLFKLDKLDVYLNSSKRKVYLDTQILLQVICYNYDDIDCDDSLYNSIKHFFETIKNSTVPISLHTTMGYVEEVAWHVYNSLRLERFLNLEFIMDLGQSKNIFFNFFLELTNIYGSTIGSFSEFIEELFDVNADEFNDTTFIDDLIRRLVERFELLDIEIETTPLFDNYEKYKREYEIVLSYMVHDQKSVSARKNDLNTILYLSEMHYNMEDGYFTEPFLITWDSSFFQARNSFRKFPELGNWYLYPPLKFANTVSLLNFKVDTKAINYNIISLVEDNFNLSSDSISFIDLLNSVFIGKDLSKWKLVSKLAKMRRNLIDESETTITDSIKNKNLPIDEFLLLILNFYQNPVNKRSYKDLCSLFQNNKYAEEITEVINSNIKSFTTCSKIKPSIIAEIDELIRLSKMKEEE